MTKRSKLVHVLSLIVLAVLMFAIALTFTQTVDKAFADTTVFEMEKKASVRLVEGSSGIRFKVKMDTATKDAVLESSDSGVLIFPKKYLTTDVINAKNYIDKKVQDDSSVDNTKTGLYDYLKVTDDNSGMKVYKGEDGWYANACITEILPVNFQLDFAAIAFYYDGSNYVYADFDADFGRSITAVLSEAYIKDGDEYAKEIIDIYGDVFGTQLNPIRISDKEGYLAFVNSINAENTYDGLFINIENSIDLGQGDGTDILRIPATFNGNLSASADVKIVYRSTNGFVAASEDTTVLDGIYECLVDTLKPGKLVDFDKETVASNGGVYVINTTMSYSSEVKYGDEWGTTKFVTNEGNDGRLGQIGCFKETDVTKYSYIALRVYNDNDYEINFKFEDKVIARCATKQWTEVITLVEDLPAGKKTDIQWITFGATRSSDGQAVEGLTIYLSALYGVKLEGAKLINFDEVVVSQYGGDKIYPINASISYSTEFKYGDESGSTKIVAGAGNDGRLYQFACFAESDITSYDYIVFRVYNANDYAINFTLDWEPAVSCASNMWTEIKINVVDLPENFQTNINNWIVFKATNSATAQGVEGLTIYLSALYGCIEE